MALREILICIFLCLVVLSVSAQKQTTPAVVPSQSPDSKPEATPEPSSQAPPQPSLSSDSKPVPTPKPSPKASPESSSSSDSKPEPGPKPSPKASPKPVPEHANATEPSVRPANETAETDFRPVPRTNPPMKPAIPGVPVWPRTTPAPITTVTVDLPYIIDCRKFKKKCCCDCYRGHCAYPYNCPACYSSVYKVQQEKLKEFLQTMPQIRPELVDYLYKRPGSLVKYIFEHHNDTSSLIIRAHVYTLTYIMNVYKDFGEHLARVNGRYLNDVIRQVSNPCEYFRTLNKKVQDILAFKSSIFAKCKEPEKVEESKNEKLPERKRNRGW